MFIYSFDEKRFTFQETNIPSYWIIKKYFLAFHENKFYLTKNSSHVVLTIDRLNFTLCLFLLRLLFTKEPYKAISINYLIKKWEKINHEKHNIICR